MLNNSSATFQYDPSYRPLLTGSFASLSAFAVNSATTTAALPLSAAQCSGVSPFCGTRLPVSQVPSPQWLVPRWYSNRLPFPNHPSPPAILHPAIQPFSLQDRFKSLPGSTDPQLRNLPGSELLRPAFASRPHDLRIEGAGFTTSRNMVQSVWGQGCRISGRKAGVEDFGLWWLSDAGFRVLRSSVEITGNRGVRVKRVGMSDW